MSSSRAKNQLLAVVVLGGVTKSGGGPMLSGSLPLSASRKAEEVVAFIEGQAVEGVDFLVEMGIPVAAADVVGECIFNGGKTAVVHVAAAIGEVAEAGSFEAAHIRVGFRYGVAADIVNSPRVSAPTPRL